MNSRASLPGHHYSSHSQQFSVEHSSQWAKRHIYLDSLLDSATQSQKEIEPETNKGTKTKHCQTDYGPAYSTTYLCSTLTSGGNFLEIL